MRCYNGAPDSALQSLLDRRAAAERKLPQGSRCVYFPSPGYYQVWADNKPVCGWNREFNDPIDACEAALEVL